MKNGSSALKGRRKTRSSSLCLSLEALYDQLPVTTRIRRTISRGLKIFILLLPFHNLFDLSSLPNNSSLCCRAGVNYLHLHLLAFRRPLYSSILLLHRLASTRNVKLCQEVRLSCDAASLPLPPPLLLNEINMPRYLS